MFSVCGDVRESSDTGDTTRPTTVARTLNTISHLMLFPAPKLTDVGSRATLLDSGQLSRFGCREARHHCQHWGNNRDRRNAVYLRGKEPQSSTLSSGILLLRRWSPVLTNIRILDPSAGWGDRLISALSLEGLFPWMLSWLRSQRRSSRQHTLRSSGTALHQRGRRVREVPSLRGRSHRRQLL